MRKHSGGKFVAKNAEENKRPKVVEAKHARLQKHGQMAEEMEIAGDEEDGASHCEAVDYFDRGGKIWHFHGKAADDEQLRQLCHQNWLTKSHTNKSTIQFVCKRRARHQCKFGGIYEKRSGTLFVRGEHNHPNYYIERGNNYVDRFGKIWRFVEKAQEGEELSQVCRQNWLVKGRSSKSIIQFDCKKVKNPHCKYRGIYEKKSASLFVYGQHNHPIGSKNTNKAEEEDENKIEDEVKVQEEDEENMAIDENGEDGKEEEDEEEPDFLDQHNGKRWAFFARAEDERAMAKLCQQNWLARAYAIRKRSHFRCRQSASSTQNRHNCKFRAMHLEGRFYTRGQHNHPIH